MTNTKKEPLFKPGHVYFLNDIIDENGNIEDAKLYDLTTLGEDKAVKIFDKAMREEI